eukprot:Seg796.9 transcript_id=Seg796.9/GoldUCD/mRNA.D3Y31 product="DNA helicase MCM8" protein_id=Seg796.9/GoldUCD/D3Y31
MEGPKKPRRFNPYKRGGNWRGNLNKRPQNINSTPRTRPFGNTQNASQSSQPRRNAINRQPCPFQKWYTYFPDKVYMPGDDLANEVHQFLEFFEKKLDIFNLEEIEKKSAIYVDYNDLMNDENLKGELPTLSNDLKDNPELHLKAISVAFHQALIDDQNADEPQSIAIPFDIPYIKTRILNYEPTTLLRNLKASTYGKLVSIRGTVVRVGNVKPLATHLAFTCCSCKAQQVLELTDGKYDTPNKCISPECRARTFVPDRGSPQTKTIDSQIIKVQEIMLDEHRETGRIPRTIECELFADLVDVCVPGDMAVVTGIVQLSNQEEHAARKSSEKCMFLLYIRAISVANCKESKTQRDTEDHKTDFSLKELYGIREIHSEKNLFKLIVGSLCPTIYGHELVKAGLVLCLFGGTPRNTDDRNRMTIRSDPHILVVGDPGLGKSQMLQAVSNAAPRGVFVCGNNTTTSGLTVTLSRESGSGEYALEAGALVLGDQGCCCIDEFDKMKSQHQALLEAMEQQSISIAKAGIVCSLPARTSIIAAANPIGGHYNKAKTVSENLKMNGALLSRFDLVFILLDNPDEELDCILSEHVMAIHSGGSSQHPTIPRSNPQNEIQLLDTDEARSQWEADKALSERLKVSRNEKIDFIPMQLLRKYIAYARKYVHPKLSPEAATILQDFYLMLRRQYRGPDSTPVTTRQLESLIRLTEARAKLELREEATGKDAEDIIEIVKFCLVDIYVDEMGSMNLERSFQGSGMSKRKQVKRFVTELTKISERDRNSLFNVDQMRQIATVLKLQTGNFQDFIESLNAQNFIIKKGSRLYQLQTASY